MTKGDRHVAPSRMEEVTAREQRSQHNTQRDDLPSRSDNDVSGIRGSAVVDLPRAGHSTSLGSSGPRRQLQPIAGNYHYSLPSHTPSDATSVLEEAHGNSLCDRMDGFHFSPQLSERQGLGEQGRTHVSRNATSSAKVTASFDIASSRTAHSTHPAGDASSFQNPSAGEHPAAAYPAFIPGHEHVGPFDQALRGDASTQEVVHSTSTLSDITSNLPYGFDDCHVDTGDGSSSSYDPPSFAGGFMQTSPPIGRTGQSITSPSRRPRAPPRSAYDVDIHTMSRKSDCGYDTSHPSGTMATAVESDAVYDHGAHIQTSCLVGDRDRQSGQSQAPSFAHCQYQSQPPHLPQHLPPRNSSDLSYAYIPAPSSQPLRSDADYSPVPNPGSESDPSPVSAPGRSVTGLTTCSSATHLQPHSAPPVLHERSCSPFYGDSHSPARQLNVALPLSSLGRSPQSSFRRGLPRGPGYERDFSASAYMDESEMRPEGWGTTLFRQPAGLSQIASSVRPDPDLFGNAYEMSMSVQPSSSSVGMEPASRHIRRWSSLSVGSTPTSRLPTAFQATSQSYTTRLRRHSQVVSPAPSLQRSTRKVSSQSPSPTPGLGHMPAQAETFDASTQGTPSAISTTTASGNLQDHEAVMCDGFAVDEESVHNALQKPDKLLHVYECFWDRENAACGMWIEGDQPSIADHLQHFHGFKGGETTTRCLWRDCPKPNMKGTSIARHVVTHVGFRIRCDTCKHEFARGDACNRAHIRSHCTGVAQPMYGDLQRVLDARKVDPSRRLTKKRRLEEL
ncbi:hypothetical protein PISMIDRAFT_325504 [Pisolithus microcarpus 441]|uniref:Uncharacterized protein n=1 Tax=Pisolithus microcarpus 441 TaxID=765257 RepID=A0A0C9ZU75_9AGAM|nr:hypothetical protein PISMIDRAFT_325504 [Pisolithus microcarpus 441]